MSGGAYVPLMNRRGRSRLLALVPAVALGVATLASAAGADPRVPTEQDVRNKVAAQGRTLDQMTNPDYLARQAQAVGQCTEQFRHACFFTDPYRVDWAKQGRGQMLRVAWTNRYGVLIKGALWAPPGAGAGGEQDSLPAVLVVNGGGAIQEQYSAFAQGLAEAGYLVLTFDPQCHGSSGCDPAPEYCEPHEGWRQQEMGVQEYGKCAGQPPGPFDSPSSAAAFGVHAATCVGTGTCAAATLRQMYVESTSAHVLGALDAVTWLLSPDNPWGVLVDEGRIGIAGHSFGSQAALLAGNGDPHRRFAAAVSWDGYGVLPGEVPPRVPTLFQRADHDEYGARSMTPDPEGAAPMQNARQFVRNGVPTGHVALGGGSTHQEWAYTPFFGAAFAGQSVASRDGERVALHYTLAWFDRFLKGPARAARERLVSPVFDDSADRSSIGQGSYDVLQQRNVPYTIGGETTAEHLSELYPSWISLPELTCADLREGCTPSANRSLSP